MDQVTENDHSADVQKNPSSIEEDPQQKKKREFINSIFCIKNFNIYVPEDHQRIIEGFDILVNALKRDDNDEFAIPFDRAIDSIVYLKNRKGDGEEKIIADLAKKAYDNFVQEYLLKIRTNPRVLNDPTISAERLSFVLALSLCGSVGNDEDSNASYNLIENKISQWGLKYSDLVPSWIASFPTNLSLPAKEGGVQGIYENLSEAIALEAKRPRIIKILVTEFGIRAFARYPLDLLIKQYDERDEDDKPYGVILYPRKDWNGALTQQKGIFQHLMTDFDRNGRYYLRIVEANSKIDMARALINFRKRYPAHKISFAIIGGHGTEKSIEFGGNDELHTLSPKDFYDQKLGEKIGSFFEDNPTIILNSCSTGKKGGIAQGLSNNLNAEVIAPDHPSSINRVNVTFSESGNIGFSVFYEESTYANDPGKRYFQGQVEGE